MSIYHPIFADKKYQRLYGIMISILYQIGKNVVVIIHIYGDFSIILIFCYHQDTESESCDIELGVAGPILKQKKYQSLYGTTISILYNKGEKCCDNSSYLWSYSHFLTIWLPQRHLMRVTRNVNWCNQNSPRKTSKDLWDNGIHTILYGRKYCGNYSYLSS